MTKDTPHTDRVKPGSITAGYLPESGDEHPQLGQSRGWFRAMRNPEAIELIRANPHAFILAYLIAHRGQYSATFNRHNLELGEALLGDYQNYGMTEQNYRTAKAQLQKSKFATLKATNRGTVGKLTDTRLFSIFRLEGNDQNNGRVTSGYSRWPSAALFASFCDGWPGHSFPECAAGCFCIHTGSAASHLSKKGFGRNRPCLLNL